MSLIRKANISDKALDLSNFNRMVDYVNMLAGMTVDQNMTISKGPPVFMLGIRPSTADTFPWDKASFGFKINPDGDNPAEVTIYSGRVDFRKDDVTGGYYQTFDTNVLISGTTSVWAHCRVLPTGLGDPLPLRDGCFVDVIDMGASGLTYWASYHLYTFVAANNSADPPVMTIDPDQTKIYRFLDIERDGSGDELPVGTTDNPHLVWDNDAGEWVIGVVVPPGVEETPHIVWNVSEEIWEAGEIVPDGTQDNQHLVWDHDTGKWIAKRILPDAGDAVSVPIWVPLEDAWTALDMGTNKFKFLQIDEAGNAVMDYGRMTNI